MSASAKIPPLYVLRGILRRLRVDPQELPTAAQQQARSSGRGATSTYVLDRYRAAHLGTSSSSESNKTITTKDEDTRAAELRKLAYEYMILRSDIDERRRLQKMDAGAENQLSPKEMSRRAAARAGLALPESDLSLN
mmetsp:Transcript_4209/g.7705  ORF Transcript_4209/g.7705 Transcript_4209/m.7705 type:complete len:137 (+) Transcript_4209:165-575(+)|eukprot:CAMPEP_0168229188 /NCGR_PEP_ID=MMETSP0140_2-20121125/15128_1 /TAXON_ID=44445 /ORGANISM="Pseudo-nitzschia australis, Strain 10249 10 AB" /LENGTH=136 /DNA_ID=CAMNT_0008160955 /DNA_START=68 /DNA_END=478 /DNA_ORIENTATION=-